MLAAKPGAAQWWQVLSHSSWYANPEWVSKPIDRVGKQVSGRWVQPGETLVVDIRYWDDYYSAYCRKVTPIQGPDDQVEQLAQPAEDHVDQVDQVAPVEQPSDDQVAPVEQPADDQVDQVAPVDQTADDQVDQVAPEPAKPKRKRKTKADREAELAAASSIQADNPDDLE